MTGVGPLSGLVLAGGQSGRMGTDKALLTIEDETLLDRAVSTLAEICAEVLVAAGPQRGLVVPNTRMVDDAAAGLGPLGGIVGGLEMAEHHLTAVLAVDHPYPNSAVFEALLHLWGGEDVVAPEVDGRAQPLHAIWARSAAPTLRAQLAGTHRSLRHAFAALDVRTADYSVWGSRDPAGDFALNVNRPEDFPRRSRRPR